MTKTNTNNFDNFTNIELPKIKENIKNQKYLLTIYQIGCPLLSGDDIEKQVKPKRFYECVSVNEIGNYTRYLDQPFWLHPNVDKDTDDDEKNNIPYEEKIWGRYSNVIIEPLSKDLEEQYLKGVKDGFFENCRNVYLKEEQTTKSRMEVVE